jgi:hypothetical protein
MKFLKGFGQFWYDFVIGDDWKIAIAVASVLLLGAVLVLAGAGGAIFLAPLLAVGIAITFTIALLIDTRRA